MALASLSVNEKGSRGFFFFFFLKKKQIQMFFPLFVCFSTSKEKRYSRLSVGEEKQLVFFSQSERKSNPSYANVTQHATRRLLPRSAS